ncbi:MAG: hypothetical protein PHT07_17370 [Paludibacter sp.]|nr:hypothetical protein [Paludibacter sp.]
MTDDYNLDGGVNTDMTLGGDSLTIPIGKTDSIFLGKILNNQNISILKKNADGTYSLQLKDSIQQKMSAINPVTFSFDPITIQSPLTIPSLNFNHNVSPIDTTFSMGYTLPAAPYAIKKLTTTSSSISKSKSGSYIVGPLSIVDNRKIKQTMLFNYPAELNKISNIFLKNNRVTLTFDKTKINNLGFASQNDTLKNFRIDFPSEFKLSSNIGVGSRIAGSSFIIENALLSVGGSGTNIYTASFLIDRMDMSNYPQNKALDYNPDINYSIAYAFSGTVNDASPVPPGSRLEVNVSLKAFPEIDDMEIMTNSFAVKVPSGSNSINRTVEMSNQIINISTLTFLNGAALQINIADPGITPFRVVSGGDCSITLPQKFIFKPYSGLDPLTNILTIPYAQLFSPKTIGIAGIKLTGIPIVNNRITVSDALTYSINDLTIGAQSSTLNTLQAINKNNDKNIKVTGSSNGLIVSIVNGKISNSGIDPITQNIDLNLPSFLKQDGNVLDVNNPVITFEIGNTMGIPIDIVMNLIPKKKGVIIPNSTVTSPTIHIAAAEELGHSTWSKFRISKSPVIYTDGYTSVVIPNLPNLLKSVPDEIGINVAPSIIGDNHSIDINSTNNKLDIKYMVDVPLDFGGDLKIQYSDTISKLKSGLKDILKLTREIEVLAKVNNQIPMDLSFTLVPLDSLGNKVTGITVSSPDTIRSGNISMAGVPITISSDIKIMMKETVSGSLALDKLDKLNLIISATKNSNSQSTPLKSNQFMIIELRARLPKGITVNQSTTK